MEMTTNRIHGIQMQLGGMLKQLWGRLSNEPEAVSDGLRDQHAGRVEERSALARQDADRQLEDFRKRNRDWFDLSRH